MINERETISADVIVKFGQILARVVQSSVAVASWRENTVAEPVDGLYEGHSVRDHRCSDVLPARLWYDVL